MSLTLSLIVHSQAGAPAEPYKFLGHGPCDSMSRSITLSHFTASASEIAHHIKALMRALRVPAPEMRGLGISVRLFRFHANWSWDTAWCTSHGLCY